LVSSGISPIGKFSVEFCPCSSCFNGSVDSSSTSGLEENSFGLNIQKSKTKTTAKIMNPTIIF